MSYDGRDITRLAAHERSNLGVSYVPQGRGMFAGLTARENLEFAWTGANGLDADTAIDGILQDLPRLQVLLDRQAGALSGGEQQILAIARGLISEPDLLLLDEPTEGIQPSIVDEIAAMLSRLQQERGLAIVVVEQNLEFLIALSDRMLLLEKGAVTGNLQSDQMRDAALIEEFAGFAGQGRIPRQLCMGPCMGLRIVLRIRRQWCIGLPGLPLKLMIHAKNRNRHGARRVALYPRFQGSRLRSRLVLQLTKIRPHPSNRLPHKLRHQPYLAKSHTKSHTKSHIKNDTKSFPQRNPSQARGHI